MAVCYFEWKVLKHGPLERVSANPWRVEGVMELNVPAAIALLG